QGEDGAEVLQRQPGDQTRRKAEDLRGRPVADCDQPGDRRQQDGERQQHGEPLHDQPATRQRPAHPAATFWSACRIRRVKTSAITAMATIIRLAIAAEAPMSKNSSPCLTAWN